MKNKKTDFDNNMENGMPGKDWLSKIPSWIVIEILKYWAAAAAVFFLTMDSGFSLPYTKMDNSNPMAVLGANFVTVVFLALGMALLNNYAVKQLVFMLHSRRNNTYRFNIINIKGLVAFLVYLVYSFVVAIILYFIVVIFGQHGLIVNLFGTTNFGLEPFSYGLFFVIVDIIFVLIKDGIVNIVQRIKYYKQIKNNKPVIIKRA